MVTKLYHFSVPKSAKELVTRELKEIETVGQLLAKSLTFSDPIKTAIATTIRARLATGDLLIRTVLIKGTIMKIKHWVIDSREYSRLCNLETFSQQFGKKPYASVLYIFDFLEANAPY